MDKSANRNPVVDVYDQFRTARLNVKYLEAQLRIWRRRNFWMEVLLAVSASSSATGIWFFQGVLGEWLWKLLTCVTALLAIAKPLLKLPEKIRRSEEMLVGYKALDFDLEKLVISIRERQCYDRELKKQFSVALDKKRKLVIADKYTEPDAKLLNQCYERVLIELPEDNFFLPDAKPT